MKGRRKTVSGSERRKRKIEAFQGRTTRLLVHYPVLKMVTAAPIEMRNNVVCASRVFKRQCFFRRFVGRVFSFS